jgi:ribosome-associated heat shock protein Hsp15
MTHRSDAAPPTGEARIRLDKWLWAARLYKTRNLAADEIVRGRVQVNGQAAKPSREVRVGDRLLLRQGPIQRELTVRGLSLLRGPAPTAQALYEETAASVAARERAAEQRRLGVEPASALAHGRPTKRDRRELTRTQVAWQRWSVSVDDG